MLSPIKALPLVLMASLMIASATAQETVLAFEGLRAASTKPMEITADRLDASQKDLTATFTGHVQVTQGGLHLSADSLRVNYAAGNKKQIDQMFASGNVLMSTPSEAAESAAATYSLKDHSLVMTGNVLLTQAGNVMSGSTLTVDVTNGTGRMDGRVKTVLQPAGN